MFTRQHYKAIAAIIKETSDMHDHPNLYAWMATDTEGLAGKLADYFAKNNPRFDREKFLEACGL